MTLSLNILSAVKSALSRFRTNLGGATINTSAQSTNRQVFEFLVADFEATLNNNDTPLAAEARKIIDDYRSTNNALTNSEIYKLDMIMLRMQEPETLLQRAETLRAQYLNLAGPELAANYRAPSLPPPDRFTDGAKKLLLADVQNLLRFNHASYFFAPLREAKRKYILRKGSTVMLCCSLVWLVTVLACIHSLDSPTLALLTTVVYAGLMGGFISSQRRVQMIPNDGDPLASITALENGEHLYWFAPATGAVFAVVLWLLFVSGVIGGTVFPTFKKDPTFTSSLLKTTGETDRGASAQNRASADIGTTDARLVNVADTAPTPAPSSNAQKRDIDKNGIESALNRIRGFEESGEFQRMFLSQDNPFLPINGASYALLLLWSFIAGFAERFVPDALDQVINRGQSKTPLPATPSRTGRIDPVPTAPAEGDKAIGRQQTKTSDQPNDEKAPTNGSIKIEIKDTPPKSKSP